MSDLDALLAGIVANPHEHVRWLIVADWLDDHGQSDRAELLRLHRMMIDTCCEPDAHPDRAVWHTQIVELIDQGVKPCIPQHTLMLPGGVPLVGNFIPPGDFLMGSEFEELEKPIHKVTLTKGFFAGLHPVTQLQWRAVMGTDPSDFKGGNRPVERVSWEDATAFCAKASEFVGGVVRLPTEAEWEYACRAGTTTPYHFGEAASTERVNYDPSWPWNGSAGGVPRERTVNVGSQAQNPWGLFDCHGNVWEWCADWFRDEYYSVSPTEDPCCQESDYDYRMMRGGAWNNFSNSCTSAARNLTDTVGRHTAIGFRVAFNLT